MKYIELSSYKLILTIAGLFVLANLSGQHMDSHRWNNRVVIVNKTIIDSDKYKNQIEDLLGAVEALRERHIVLYEISKKGVRFTDFENDKTDQRWKEITNSDLKKYARNNDFSIMLIGLDGGVKYTSGEFLSNENLFAFIDAMPMRRSELRKEKGRNRG